MHLEISCCLGYGPKSFNVKGYDAQAKINCFVTNWHGYLIILYQCHIWLVFTRIMVFLVRGRDTENIKKEGNRHWKTLKNEEKEKRRRQGKSNNTMNIFGFTFYIKDFILLEIFAG